MINHEVLADAIIDRAAKDYFRASYTKKLREKYECLRFFRSKWFERLTLNKVNSDHLITRLDKEVERVRDAEEKIKATGAKYRILWEVFSIAVCRNEKSYTWNSQKNIDDFIKEISE